MTDKKVLRVRFEVQVEVDIEEYRDAYGHETLEDIRDAVTSSVHQGLEATFSTGIHSSEVRWATMVRKDAR